MIAIRSALVSDDNLKLRIYHRMKKSRLEKMENDVESFEQTKGALIHELDTLVAEKLDPMAIEGTVDCLYGYPQNFIYFVLG